MTNLAPHVTTVEAAVAYRQRILDAVPAGHNFTPLMTCYLTDSLDPKELERGFNEGVFTAGRHVKNCRAVYQRNLWTGYRNAQSGSARDHS